jgi:hypothetical protein
MPTLLVTIPTCSVGTYAPLFRNWPDPSNLPARTITHRLSAVLFNRKIMFLAKLIRTFSFRRKRNSYATCLRNVEIFRIDSCSFIDRKRLLFPDRLNAAKPGH